MQTYPTLVLAPYLVLNIMIPRPAGTIDAVEQDKRLWSSRDVRLSIRMNRL